MHIAITGGAGFIGTELARRLAKAGHTLTLIDIKKSAVFPDQSVIADVTDPAALARACAGAEVIYHLAAEHRDDVRPLSRYYEVNVEGAKNLCRAADAANIKNIIFTSSVALYGLAGREARENDPPDPFNEYGRSKWQAEQVFNAWAAADPSRRVTHVRLVATFGPGNRGNIYNLMAQIAGGRFIMIGGGHNRKSIASVENVAAFLQHCLSLPHPGAQIYNYADKPDLSTGELVRIVRNALGRAGMGLRLPYVLGLGGGMVLDMLASITGRTFPVSAVRVRKFCAQTIVNADKARASGFAPPVSLPDALRAMMAAEFAAHK